MEPLASSERGARPGGADTDLVMAAREGNRAALGLLLTKHRPALMALCSRMLRDPMLAEDVAQEACLQAMLGLDSLLRPESFG
ncbi:MAG: RNA polymerase sigma factor, partial [Actinomycetota bacterium]